ncbi:MAG: ADP-ribosyltransferase, partial [Bacteroidales bacterium]|nr:ADP-ribosyltransferase [Bacteroidales bacterium]
AQRLARTLVQHGYQQSFVATTQKNPFITEYIWRSNGSRVCELCLARDGKHYKKDELELDHPNGMCTMEPVVADDMVDQLANWFNSSDGTYPDIDEFAGNFGYNASKLSDVKTAQDFVNKYGLSTKSPNAWFNSLTPVQKAEAKMLKEQSGLTWNEWYEQNVHSTGDATQDFVKKYGTSTKSPNAWYNSLTSAQKAEAKLLKEQSGLTWNDWYNKNVYAGNGAAPATKTIKAFSSVQDKYLSPYGFSPDNMPTSFDDWSHKISHEQAGEILKSMGTSWGDPHPYQQLMKYYNANLTNANFVDQVVDTTVAAKKATTAAKVASKVDNAFDVAKWTESIKWNNLDEMNQWTDDWLKTISATEKSGVRTYTGSAYTDMNRYLRGQSSSTSYAKEIKACQSALSKASLPKETIVRRGSDYNMLKELGIGNVTPQNKNQFIGAIVTDKGFVSTSPTSGGGFSGSIEYVIKLPQGSQAMYVDSISRFEGELELLINCGGKYMVEEVEFNSYGEVKKIYMTLTNLKN